MPRSIAPGAGGRKFRAFDKVTGAVAWEIELPAGTTGAPMTYMFDGKQYLLVAIGSVDHAPEYIALESSVIAKHLADDRSAVRD